VRLRHFEAFRPLCPHCLRTGAGPQPLVVARVAAERDGDILTGVLHCPNQACQHEYPILDGLPLIVPELRRLLSERGIELMLRDDLDPGLESLFGDGIGPDSWFDSLRQTVSTYGWDGYADLDLEEVPDPGGPQPGAARRCLERLLELGGAPPPGPMIDAGCGAGRSSFALAARHPDALVLGCDLNLALLRLARRVAVEGRVRYARRRIGLAYDRRDFAAALPGAERVDFWACDATCLPFAPSGAAMVSALNLFDCVPDPPALLAALAAQLAPGGRLLLATPYDWSTRATAVQGWVGGHSQRGLHGGAAEPQMRAMLAAVPGLRLVAEQAEFPWHTRLHDRSCVSYRGHLIAAARDG
jgi:SAM-dependent methyltransferase